MFKWCNFTDASSSHFVHDINFNAGLKVEESQAYMQGQQNSAFDLLVRFYLIQFFTCPQGFC